MTTTDLEHIARRRAGAKVRFYIHATVYLLVNAFLVAMEQLAVPGFRWSITLVLGWGLGLAIHFLAVFFASSGSALRERLVADELRRLRAKYPGDRI